MSVSYWKSQSLKSRKVVSDVCIVGGGITGFSVAYWLNKEDPSLKVTILEKNTLGSGATSRNAGFVTCGSVEHFNRMVSKHGEEKALDIWRFAEKNLQLLQSKILPKSPIKSLKKKGAFSLASIDTEFSELKQVASLMTKNNIAVEVLGETDVQNRLGAVGFVGGIKYKEDAEVDPMELLVAMQSQVQCDFIENAEVARVETLDQGHRRVIATGVEVECTLVIYCTNGYSTALNPYFEDKIYPTRGQILVLEPVKPFMEGPCYANFYLDYFRQLTDGSLLIGGFRQLESDTEKGFSDHTTEKIQGALHQFVKDHLPQFRDKKVSHRWAGVMGFSVDGEPLIGSLPTDPQSFFCGGFTGHGLGLSFHSAKTLVDLIFGRSIPDWISARRF